MIADQLKENLTVIEVVNRAQIVDDSFSLAWDGLLHYRTALHIAEYLEKEVEFYPWFAAYKAFTKLKIILSPHEEANKNITVRTWSLERKSFL